MSLLFWTISFITWVELAFWPARVERGRRRAGADSQRSWGRRQTRANPQWLPVK